MIHLLDTAGLHRDPRTRMQQEQQERKISGPKQPDGSKLSFAEKMKLFAQEVVNKNSTFCWDDIDTLPFVSGRRDNSAGQSENFESSERN